MKMNEYFIEGMRTFLDDEPEAFTAYEAYMRLSDNPVLWEKIKSRERCLTDQHLDRVSARQEGKRDVACEIAIKMREHGLDDMLIAKTTGLPLSEVEGLN